MAVLHHIDDEDDPYKIVESLLKALPPGSYLALTHPASDIDAEPMARMAAGLAAMLGEPVTLRSREQVGRFSGGLDLAEPGLVLAPQWRPAGPASQPELGAGGAASQVALWAGVAAKP